MRRSECRPLAAEYRGRPPRGSTPAWERPGARIERGFAYLWTLLMVALLGLGLTAGVQLQATAAQRDKERELLAIGRQFRAALASYHATQRGAGAKPEYPVSLDDLLHDKRVPGVARHLRKVFVDPMTGRAEWGFVRVDGRIVGVHSLSDAVPIKQDRFEAEDAAFVGKKKYSQWVFSVGPR